MLRTIFSIGLFAILGLIALKFIFGIFGFAVGLFMWLLIAAVKGTGERAYFRFYDPEVLALLAPTFNARQHYLFFGDIEIFWMEGNAGGIARLNVRG